jgi:hypothetical protein
MTTEVRHPETPEQALEQAMEDGVRLLEREYGRDWYRKIDLDRLVLASGNFCILGQLEGRRRLIEESAPDDDFPVTEETPTWELNLHGVDGYDTAVSRLALDDGCDCGCGDGEYSSPTLYGFNSGDLPYDGVDEDGNQRQVDISYSMLQEVWERKIKALLDAGHSEV